MDEFPIDSDIPYDEWVKTINHHALAYVPISNEPRRLLLIAQCLMDEGKKMERAGKFDSAYYYVMKCLQVFDQEKVGVDIRKSFPEARKYMVEALDAQAHISAGGLKKVYNERIRAMHNEQERRSTTVAHQLESDPSVDFSESTHTQKQVQLLSSEQNTIDALRAQLGQGQLKTLVKPATSLQPSTARTPQYAPTLHGTQQLATPLAEPQVQSNGTFPSPQYTAQGGPTNGTPDMYRTTYGNDYGCEESRRLAALLHEQGGPRQRNSTTPNTPSKPRYTHWQFNLANFPLTAPRRGIVNLGNTCYMNSVIQMINGTPLADYFMDNQYQSFLVSSSGNQVKVANAFIYVIRELRRKGCNFAVSSSAFRNAVGEAYKPFRNSSQQDANEFLRVLLDTIHSALNERGNTTVRFPEIDNTQGSDEELSRKFLAQYVQKNYSVVTEYCAFQERSMLVCPACGLTSRSFATTFGIEVPIAKTSRISLEDCLRAYTAKELLDKDSLYSCPRCKKKVQATKQLQFYSAPKVLFITLKRFRSYGDFSNVAKINDEVFFERALDLSPFMCSDFSRTQYDLVSVVKHQGNMHGGHFTADVIGSDKVWCDFSDERVLRAVEPDFRQAYILCYARTN